MSFPFGFWGRFWRRRTLRTRLVALATAALLVALALSLIVLVTVLKVALERTVDASLKQTASEIATLIDEKTLPEIEAPTGGTTLVQVVDANGVVVSSSAGADHSKPMLPLDQLATLVRTGKAEYKPGYRFLVSGIVRAYAISVGPPTARRTVLVAVPADDVQESLHILRVALPTGYAVLLVLLVALAWRMVGAALRPVEELRRGAEAVTGSQRLPVPRAHDELYRLAVTLNTMLTRLEGSRSRQRAFVADAAHELRSPLASLRTQVEVAEVTGLPAETADLLADIERLTRLVDDLLLLARLDDAPPRRRSQPVELGSIVDTVVSRRAEARVPVRRTGDIESAIVDGDPDELVRVLTNLVENAVRHAETKVEVALTASAGTVLLQVVDDGPGIPAVDRERVFARFTRRDDARDRDSGGAGLGLAIARELVVRHGGRITLDDASPHGLAATVRLPASQVLEHVGRKAGEQRERGDASRSALDG
jgi:signal transduction histidine kinase